MRFVDLYYSPTQPVKYYSDVNGILKDRTVDLPSSAAGRHLRQSVVSWFLRSMCSNFEKEQPF